MKNLLLWSYCFVTISSTNAFAKSKCVGHRGNNKYHFENSMPSLISAYEVGAHGIEFDIVMTKEGIPVVNHDDNFARVARSTNGGSCDYFTDISKLSFEDIRRNCELKNGTAIPSLEDVFEYFHNKDIMLFIELKSKPSEYALDLIEKYYADKPEKIRIISFKKKWLAVARSRSKTSQFWDDIKTMRLSKIAPKWLFTDGVDVHWAAMGSLRIAKIFGLETAIWTANKKSVIKEAKRRNIDFITTDDPKLCLDLLNSFKYPIVSDSNY